MQRKNLHVLGVRVLAAEVIVQCRHRFFWILPGGIDWVGPSVLSDWYSDVHPGEDFWEIFHRVLALQEDLTFKRLLWFVCLQP
jgi:hypothetical protein